jgi:hypothetical protein
VALKSGRLLFLLACLTGCASQQEQQFDQLSQVAKGWCLSIRASQVIAVYPLTEDIKVGDMFIVQRPTEDEVYEYETNGFLPMGQLLHRLDPTGLDGFYKDGTAVNCAIPAIASTTRPVAASQAAVTTRSSATSQPSDWENLPRSAFPSYTFETNRSGGLNAQLPIKGIPVALGFLDADSASVTVTLSDAYTYGLDMSSLDQQVRDWADEHKSLLKQYRPKYLPPTVFIPIGTDSTEYHKQYNYLRVISRVYFIRAVDVTATNTGQTAAELSVGNPPSLTLLNSTLSTTQPSTNLTSSNASPATQPSSQQKVAGDVLSVGGQLQFSAASKGSVTLTETFDRPMSIGYLAFDIPIGEDGSLGDFPVCTQIRLISLGAGFGKTTIAEWAAHDPDAEQKLDAWLKTCPNKALLDNVRKETGKEVTGEDLQNYLINHATPTWAYFMPLTYLFAGFQNPLYDAIMEDVIKRPPGLRQPQPSTQPSTQT